MLDLKVMDYIDGYDSSWGSDHSIVVLEDNTSTGFEHVLMVSYSCEPWVRGRDGKGGGRMTMRGGRCDDLSLF